MEKVVLVDIDNNDIGEMEKIQAHLHGGRLHRAFSGFVFNKNGELLIQKRASCKYHNPGIWANTVCSHQFRGESAVQAAGRRILFELGFNAVFNEVGKFVYKKTFSNGLTEWEFDHVCIADYNGEPVMPNPNEVEDVRWISLPDLNWEIKKSPEKFSFWLREILRLGLLCEYAGKF